MVMQQQAPGSRRSRERREGLEEAFERCQPALTTNEAQATHLLRESRRATADQAGVKERHPDDFNNGTRKLMVTGLLGAAAGAVIVLDAVALRQTVVYVAEGSLSPQAASVIGWIIPMLIVFFEVFVGVMYAEARQAWDRDDEAGAEHLTAFRRIAYFQAVVIPSAIVAPYLAKATVGLEPEDFGVLAFLLGISIAMHFATVLSAPTLLEHLRWLGVRGQHLRYGISARSTSTRRHWTILATRHTCHEMQRLNRQATTAGIPLTVDRLACHVRYFANTEVMGFEFIPYGDDCQGWTPPPATAGVTPASTPGSTPPAASPADQTGADSPNQPQQDGAGGSADPAAREPVTAAPGPRSTNGHRPPENEPTGAGGDPENGYLRNILRQQVDDADGVLI